MNEDVRCIFVRYDVWFRPSLACEEISDLLVVSLPDNAHPRIVGIVVDVMGLKTAVSLIESAFVSLGGPNLVNIGLTLNYLFLDTRCITC